MTYEEVKVLLEATATNLLGDSCSVEDERKRKLMLKKYDAIDIAIKALEKQIPKKVGKMKETDYGSPYYCPECEAEIIPVEFFNTDGSEPEEKVSYCWKCGQAIDWSSEDGR